MTTQEFNILVKSLKAAYPSQTFLPDEWSAKLWYAMLKDIPYKNLTLAIHKYIQSQHFPPAVADIRQLATEVSMEMIPDWSVGWQEVGTAISRYGYYRYEDAIASMNPVTQECVKRIGWYNLCMNENQASNRKQFCEIYESVQERKKSDALLSTSLLEQIETRKAEIKMIGVGDHEGGTTA